MTYTLFNKQGEIEVDSDFVKSCQVFIDLFEEFETDDNTDPIPITESFNLENVKLMVDYFSKINNLKIKYNSEEISYLDYITNHKQHFIENYTNKNIDPPHSKEIVDITDSFGDHNLEKFIEMDSFFNNKKLIQAIVIYIVSFIRTEDEGSTDSIMDILMDRVQESMN